MSAFSVKQHEKLLRLLIDTAAKTKKETFYVSLKQVAGIFDFMNLLWDEEELEFVLEDVFMDLDEAVLVTKLVGEDGRKSEVRLESAGVKKADYRGDGRNLFFTVDPRLPQVKYFTLELSEEEDEDSYEDEE